VGGDVLTQWLISLLTPAVFFSLPSEYNVVDESAMEQAGNDDAAFYHPHVQSPETVHGSMRSKSQ
jgi:hypothetical protein